MGLLELKRRGEVPEDLPELISEEIERELTQMRNEANGSNSQYNLMIEGKFNSSKNNSYPDPIQFNLEIDSDQSFFAQLERELLEENDSIEDLEPFLKKRLYSTNVLEDMKGHWKEKRKVLELDMQIKEYRSKILDKISHLKEIEKSWQQNYFNLIEREEKIKEEELELKKLLEELTSICDSKRRLNELYEFESTQNNKNSNEFNN